MTPISFRVYPENKSLFYKTHIFDTKKEMRKYLKKHHPNRNHNNTAGYCISYDTVTYASGKAVKSRRVGEIFYNKELLGSGVCSHECDHATTYYLGRKYKTDTLNILDPKIDEEHAWIQGNIYRQVILGMIRYKLI